VELVNGASVALHTAARANSSRLSTPAAAPLVLDGNCLGGADSDVVTLASTAPEVSAAQASLPMSDTCRAPDGAPGAQPATHVVTNLAVTAPLTAELFRVTVTASALGTDGRAYDEIREFTGCR
jgi:hypothetical protein